MSEDFLKIHNINPIKEQISRPLTAIRIREVENGHIRTANSSEE
jgi:hypothetical protein